MRCEGICADIGEGGPHEFELLPWIQAANICVGGYAGTDDLTRSMIAECQDRGILVGLHPGYLDRAHFGRRSIPPTAGLGEEMANLVRPWSGADYVKPHGAFYNQAATESWAADALTTVLRVWGIPLLGLAGTLHEDAAAAAHVEFWPEAFLDRGMLPSGLLVPRDQPGAFLQSPEDIREQWEKFQGRVKFFCVHGDGENGVEIAQFGSSLWKGSA
jgi:UPF0271 protein